MTQSSDSITKTNRKYYDDIWGGQSLREPSRFNTWPVLSPLAKTSPRRLEIGPGMWPRLPVQGTEFIDLSLVAVERLNGQGGKATLGTINALPFPDASFDLLCTLDVVEHVANDQQAFQELSRVTKDDGVLFLSVPLHETHWTDFDEFVGHFRRFNPDKLLKRLAENSFKLEKSANYGSKPRSKRLVSFGLRFFKRFQKQGLYIHNRLLFPLSLYFQKKLDFKEGLLDSEDIEEVLLVCRRAPREEVA
jgi:SAM-dependent methyltransferase